MRRTTIAALVIAASGLLLGMPLVAGAEQFGLEHDESWWMEGGFGGARVHTQAEGLPGRRGAAVLSAGIGVRANKNFGVGFEYASNASMTSCTQWDCGGQTWEFKPNFHRATLFGELRLLQGRLRLRYGFGDNSFCYDGGTGFDLWYLMLESLADDDAEYGQECSAWRYGTVHTASIGYHWHWLEQSGPVTAGLRLGIERGGFRAKPRIDMPAFGYRAVTLTLQLSFN